MRIRLDGRLGAQVTAKDVALRIIAEVGVAGGRGHVVEYCGTAVAAMAMEARMTLCNLNIEMGGRSGFVAPDEATFAWIAGRPFAPTGAQWEAALAHWRTLRSDDGAKFDRDVVLDCSTLEPQITWGTDPSQVVGISGRVPDPAGASDGRREAIESALKYMGLAPGMALAGLPVNRVFIGPAPTPACRISKPRPRVARRKVRRGRHRAGRARLVDGEARGGGEGSTACSATRASPGADPAARCAPAAWTTAARAASASSRPPTAISRTARARACAPTSRARRPRRRRPLPAISPMCGRWSGA
jgi:3-isopropylmalate/(R)-2-methylmalate dehydratase large subunit